MRAEGFDGGIGGQPLAGRDRSLEGFSIAVEAFLRIPQFSLECAGNFAPELLIAECSRSITGQFGDTARIG